MKSNRFKRQFSNIDFLKKELQMNEDMMLFLMSELTKVYKQLSGLANTKDSLEKSNYDYWKRYIKWKKELWRMQHNGNVRKMDN